jgi:hypothetical protein
MAVSAWQPSPARPFPTEGQFRMSKHTARDTKTRAKFHIVGYDKETGMVELYQSRDGWVHEFEPLQLMPWTEFIDLLREGRFEIYPAKPPRAGHHAADENHHGQGSAPRHPDSG